MTKLVYGRDIEVADWVAARLDGGGNFGPCAAIGVETDRLIAGVVYNQYTGHAICVSIASESPLWARHMRDLLAYPFVQLGVYKVWCCTAANNARSLRLTDRIGFKREAILGHHFGLKRHAVISRMLRPDFFRIFGGLNGKIV